MVDIDVKSEATWVCHSQLPVYVTTAIKDEEDDEVNEANWFSCSSDSSAAAIGRLLVISEARTMEVYDQTGEYCGTVRGTREDRTITYSTDRGPFFRKQLILEQPSSACEAKLLSLGGRTSILVYQVVVGLQSCPNVVPGPGIDLQQVQSLVEEMGASLSPGAQNLMEMVQFQQKNQTASLGGFLPLLMSGGAFPSLMRGVGPSPAASKMELQPADSSTVSLLRLLSPPPESSIRAADLNSSSENEAMSEGSSSSSPDLPLSGVSTNNTTSPSENDGPMSHTQLAEMMSHFLKGQNLGQKNPEFLPLLQSVCGQVTQLRLDDTAEKEKMRRSEMWVLDSVMERRLEEMERRLKEHLDRRLDALEHKLDKLLLTPLNHGATNGSAGETGPTGPVEKISPTPAVH
ncbi:ATPase PAAT isoform 2-T2 [Pholidichthys leucotaenia]